MTTFTHLRTRVAARRERTAVHRMLRNADPRVRAEVLAIAQRDLGWN